MNSQLENMDMEQEQEQEYIPEWVSECDAFEEVFDERCAAWSEDEEYNLRFINERQRYANDLLRMRGYLFLREVYTMLGLPFRIRDDFDVLGWIYDKDDPECDNFVAFDPEVLDDKRILLHFNWDGNIWERLK